MIRIILNVMTAAALFAGACWSVSAQNSGEAVLIENAEVKVTRADYETELLRVPPEMRDAFAGDPKRIAALLNNLLIGKALAADARKVGIDRDPTIQRRIALEAEKVLAQAQVQRIEESAGAEFGSKEAAYLAKARETYLVNAKQYQGLTFEGAKDSIMNDLRKRYVEEQRDTRINAIRNDPAMKVNQAAIDGLVVRTDPRLMRPEQPASGAAPK